ncbi:MAG: hypothetical protein ACPLZH_02950, partial [Minisyncoccales bacterium]
MKEAIRSAAEDFKSKFFNLLNSILKEILEWIKEVSKISTSQTPSPQEKIKTEEQLKKRKVDDLTIEAIRSKIKKSCFEINLRLIVMAQTEERAKEVLSKLESAFKQFESPFNSFVFQKVKDSQMNDFIYNFSFRIFNQKEMIVLNAEELAGLFHFPIPQTKLFGLQTVYSRENPPPIGIPDKGELMIGQVLYR